MRWWILIALFCCGCAGLEWAVTPQPEMGNATPSGAALGQGLMAGLDAWTEAGIWSGIFAFCFTTGKTLSRIWKKRPPSRKIN